MFKWLTTPAKILNPGSKKTWLQHDDEYLFTLKLTGVEDPLDPKPLWLSHYAGGDTIRHSLTNDSSQRLLEALNSHRHSDIKYDDNYQEQILDLRVYSDVIIWIAEKHWINADKTGGAKISVMVDQLQKLHRDEFAGTLYQDRTPHYCIMPAQSLAENEVICQFGLSVFIPGEADKKIADLSLRYQDNGHPFKEWIFREKGHKITRPAGLYLTQHYLQIAADKEKTNLIAPIWFSNKQGYIQIDLAGGKDENNLHQLYADNEHIKAGKLEQGLANRLSCCFYSLASANEKISLEITPEIAIADRMAKQTHDPAQQLRHLTVGFFSNPTAEANYQLTVKAIALPRLDSDRSNPNSIWQFALNQHGKIVAPGSKQESLRFLAYRDKQGLWYQRIAMQAPQKAQIPQEIIVEQSVLKLTPTPLKKLYHGFLELPIKPPYIIAKDIIVVGRNTPEESKDYRISLDLLDHPGTLFNTRGKPYLSMNYLHLSGNHFECQINADNSLAIRHISTSSPLYILDKNLKIRKSFAQNSQEESQLKPGEHLLIGCYLLEFQPSGEYT